MFSFYFVHVFGSVFTHQLTAAHVLFLWSLTTHHATRMTVNFIHAMYMLFTLTLTPWVSHLNNKYATQYATWQKFDD